MNSQVKLINDEISPKRPIFLIPDKEQKNTLKVSKKYKERINKNLQYKES